MAWSVRGRSSSVFGPSIEHGDRQRRSIALTFDDGPSPGTLQILALLREYNVPATFFLCGANVSRHREIARELAAAGHELGNHSHTHPNFALKTPSFIEAEFASAQQAIREATGVSPALLRAPYGVRWFGFRAAQRRLGLMGLMWSVIGLDWKLRAPAIAARILARAQGGDIICLHDGRTTQVSPNIGETVEAVRRVVPELLRKGYHFETATQLLCPLKSAPTT